MGLEEICLITDDVCHSVHASLCYLVGFPRGDPFEPLDRLDDDWKHVETVRYLHFIFYYFVEDSTVAQKLSEPSSTLSALMFVIYAVLVVGY